MRLPLRPVAVYGVAKEVGAAAAEFRPLVVSGAPGPARELAAWLGAGADPGAVRDASGRPLADADLDGAELLVHVVAGPTPSVEDEDTLRRAERRLVAAVCVVVGATGPAPDVPYVLATDVVPVAPASPLALDAVAERIGARAGERAFVLAARVPALRPAVCAGIVRSFSRRNGVLGAAIFIPGADFPVLTLNQVRMVFQIAAAYGERVDRERALELLAVVGAGFVLRTVARQLLAFVPGPGWATKGAVAYAGTRALGETAIAYFDAGLAERVAGAVRPGS